MSMGWVGACDVADEATVAGDATAAVLTDMASWGPANAIAAHANRTIPDRRIRISRPPPSRYLGRIMSVPGGPKQPGDEDITTADHSPGIGKCLTTIVGEVEIA
jgi:hypothetical protein